METKKSKVLFLSLVGMWTVLFSLSAVYAQTDVTLSVTDGMGVRAATYPNPNYPDMNVVKVSLDNPADKVGILQVDICSGSCNVDSQNPGEDCVEDGDCPDGLCEHDLGSELVFSGSEVAPRAEALNHSISFNDISQCVEVRFFWTQPYGSVYIAEGSGTVATLNFDVSQFAPGGNCPAGGDLTMSAVNVLDEFSGGLTVTENPGKFCYYNCGSDLHCDDGIFCNGVETCYLGVPWCQDAVLDPCSPLLCDEAADQCYCDADGQCDDGLFCNGEETCNVGTGNCQGAPPPCSDTDPCTDDCDEGSEDPCQQVCNADGPWDACCASSAVCASDDICNEVVTLTIGNEDINPPDTNGEITVSLANLSHQVKAVQVDICDEDDSLVCTNCDSIGRAAALACTVNEQENGCCGVTVADMYGGATIGTGPEAAIFTLDVTTAGTKPYGHCKGLTVDRDIFRIIGATGPLVALPVDGKVCYLCTPGGGSCWDGNLCTNDECNANGKCVYTNLTGSCNDGDSCTTNDQCRKSDIDSSKNVCAGTDPCSDDDDYCSGVEYCGGGVCSETGDPCGALSCSGDLCPGSDVTLEIEDAYGREGAITIALDNSSDEVSEVHVNVCDADQREWLHISKEDCTTTGRAGAFICTFKGLCAVGGELCSPTTQSDDCSMKCDGTGIGCQVDGDCKVCSISENPCSDDSNCAGACSLTGNPCFDDTDCLQLPSPQTCIGSEGTCVDTGAVCDSCSNFDLGNGCVGVEISSTFPLDLIEAGTGAIAEINYTVDPVTIPAENYADLVPQSSDVKDRDALTLLVTPQPGRLIIADLCEGDFDGDTDVDAEDVSAFLADFGRSVWNNKCTDEDLCNGDFNCDNDVDSEDLAIFQEDFGRSLWFNPCPLPLSPLACQY
jgi:hypothetical protein